MAVCEGRRRWLVLTLGVLACADQAPVELGADGRPGSDADPSSTGTSPATTGAESDDAGTGATRPADAGSCNDLAGISAQTLRDALAAADQNCSSDTDCKNTYLSSDCFHGCDAVVSPAAQRALDLAVATQNSTTCAEFESRGCVATTPPCKSPDAVACIGGECRYLARTPSSYDAGTTKAPLALDGNASGMLGELVPGQRLEVKLGTLGSAGSWSDPELSSSELVFLQKVLSGSPNPGGPTYVFVFQAVRAGEVELTVRHTTYEPFKLTVTIR
jgi:hypothetical protein